MNSFVSTHSPREKVDGDTSVPPAMQTPDAAASHSVAEVVATLSAANSSNSAAGCEEVIGGFAVHPAAAVLPLMDGEEFDQLVASIEQNGQRDPVDLQGNVLIEGRNRVRAVELLKARGVTIQLRTAQWQPQPGQTVAEYVADKNLHRRHLSSAQRAQIAADLLPMIEQEKAVVQRASRIKPGQVLNPNGINQHTAIDSMADAKSRPPSDQKAANRVKLDRSTIGRIAAMGDVTPYAAAQAKTIKKHASQDDIDAVKAGRKKPKEVIDCLATPVKNNAPARNAKRINHPFTPRDEFEQDVLLGWIRLIEQKLGITERGRARKVMRAIFVAEEAPQILYSTTADEGAK